MESHRNSASPLRLITTEATPAAELAKTVEALLVVASQPLSPEELAAAAQVDVHHIGEALELLTDRYCEEASGIVLELVAGGWAFRASAAASEACARLFEKPVEKGLSRAALETLAIVAYLGPITRPDVARIRGVNVDGVIAGLAERGLIAEGGRENEFGAIRYRTTPLFERVFGLESLASLPRVDDLGADVTEIRERLEAVAEKRPA
jgi:segregation and condensation protein B